MIRTEHYEKDWVFSFVEYSPEKGDEKLPLIIFLHGAGERGNDLSLVDVHGFSKYIKDKEIPCRFVLPQCPENSAWVFKVESVLNFINQIIKNYNVDIDRVYLTGLSMGGFGTWFTAMAKPDMFAAIVPCCGGGMAWYADVLDMPIWVFHGAEDNVVSPMLSDDMVKSLEALGKNVKYTRLEGVGHNVWDYTYGQELLDWLLSNKRK